jgi:hypothetical protein
VGLVCVRVCVHYTRSGWCSEENSKLTTSISTEENSEENCCCCCIALLWTTTSTSIRLVQVLEDQHVCSRDFHDMGWITSLRARVNLHPPMHQLAVLSTGWVAFFHLAPDGAHHSRFLFAADHCTFFFFFFWFLAVFPGPDLTHTYPAHFPTVISIAPTY